MDKSGRRAYREFNVSLTAHYTYTSECLGIRSFIRMALCLRCEHPFVIKISPECVLCTLTLIGQSIRTKLRALTLLK